MYRYDVINFIIGKFGFKKYLEIGVFRPEFCFDLICAEEKMGVDPGIEYPDNPVKYKMTSDEFFSRLHRGELDLPADYKWDVIFIDGLHISHQVLKDVNNSLNHLSEGGYIILHDCNPPTAWHQREDYFIDGSFKPWNGTVWKVIYYLRSQREDLKIGVADTDWGMGIITKGNSELIPFDNPFFEYNKMRLDRERNLGLFPVSDLETWLS